MLSSLCWVGLFLNCSFRVFRMLLLQLIVILGLFSFLARWFSLFCFILWFIIIMVLFKLFFLIRFCLNRNFSLCRKIKVWQGVIFLVQFVVLFRWVYCWLSMLELKLIIVIILKLLCGNVISLELVVLFLQKIGFLIIKYFWVLFCVLIFVFCSVFIKGLVLLFRIGIFGLFS